MSGPRTGASPKDESHFPRAELCEKSADLPTPSSIHFHSVCFCRVSDHNRVPQLAHARSTVTSSTACQAFIAVSPSPFRRSVRDVRSLVLFFSTLAARGPVAGRLCGLLKQISSFFAHETRRSKQHHTTSSQTDLLLLKRPPLSDELHFRRKPQLPRKLASVFQLALGRYPVLRIFRAISQNGKQRSSDRRRANHLKSTLFFR